MIRQRIQKLFVEFEFVVVLIKQLKNKKWTIIVYISRENYSILKFQGKSPKILTK